MLGASAYLLGVLELAVIFGAAGFAALRLRSHLLPGWSGPPALLGDGVLAIALLLGVAELLGTVGAFRELPLVASMVIVAIAVRLRVARPEPSADRPPAPPAPPAGDTATIVAFAVAALLIAHWSIATRISLDTGMTGFDSTWYHGPFAADFAQSGSTFDLNFIAPQYLVWFYPANSELLHGIGIVALGRDLLSPLLNLGWLSAALLAAWCIGRPYGVGPISMVGVALVLDAGLLADQAGEARNDIPAIALVLAASAVVLNGWMASGRRLEGGTLIVAGLASGLAAGTKLNYLAPALALLVGVVVLAGAAGRRRAAAAFGLPALAAGGYWFLRNLVEAGSPLPWIKELGPISLPAPDQAIGGRQQHGILDYLFDGGTWKDWFLPGLHEGLGVVWPLLLALAAGAAIACLARRAEPPIRVLGVVGLATVAAWLLAPASAEGPDAMPVGFASGLRYLAPALAILLALLPIAPAVREGRRRWLLLAALIFALPFVDASGDPWYSGYVLGAFAVGVAAFGLLLLFRSRRLSRVPRLALAGGLALMAVLAVGAGWRLQRDYLDGRYAEPGFTTPGLDAAFAWARDLQDQRIATSGTRQYPLFGTDLSNRVRFVGVDRPNAGFVRPSTCQQWRRALSEGGYDFVVTSLDRFEPAGPRFPPEAAWTRDPNAEVVLRKAPTVVFRLNGPLNPNGCKVPARAAKKEARD